MDQVERLGEPLPERVIVVRALPGIGDLLCVVPALRALRKGLPDAEISLLGLSSARWFVQRFGRYLDHFVEFPGYPGIPERPPDVKALPDFFKRMQDRRYDLAIQMHGSGIASNPFTTMLGARLNAGFYVPSQYCPDESRFLPFEEQEPEVIRYVRLMEFLGIAPQGTHLEFPLRDRDVEELESIPEARQLTPGEYVCIHPGAKEIARRWPIEKFAAVADALDGMGFRVVLTGTSSETHLVGAVADNTQAEPVSLAGRTSLGSLAVLLSGARMLICNDTGVSHLAAALRVPSVVIFTASDPARWAPLNRELHRVVGGGGQPAGSSSVEEVLAQMRSLLDKEGSRAA